MTGDRLALVLRVLDHQIVGPSGVLLGKVDELVLSETGEDLVVTGLVTGPAGLGVRLPGRLGSWVMAIWRRLHPAEDPRPVVVPLSHVRRIGSAVVVSAWAQDLLAGTAGFEMWLRRHVVGRIPGATGGEDRLAGEPVLPVEPRPEYELHAEARLLGRLLGAPVVGSDGQEVGRVVEVGAVGREQTGLEVGRLSVVDLDYGNRVIGGGLGITAVRGHGPRLVAHLLRAWHAGDRRVALTDVAHIDWEQPRVALKEGARPVHPLAE